MRGSRIQCLTLRAKIDDARRFRHEALSSITSEIDADVAAVWHVRNVDDRLYFGAGDVTDADGQMWGAPLSKRRPVPRWFADQIRCPKSTVRRYPKPADRSQFDQSDDPDLSDVLVPEEIGGQETTFSDGITAHVVDESRFIAGITLWRTSPSAPFPGDQRKQLDELCADLRPPLVEAVDLETQTYREQAGTILLRPNGVVTHMSPAVEVWFEEHHRRKLVDYIECHGRSRLEGYHFLFGMEATVAPLSGVNFEPVYKLELQPAPVPRICYESLLTPAQREVAHLATEGNSTVEIAESLVCSPHTVKTHLRDIYQRLDISSRVELFRKLRH